MRLREVEEAEKKQMMKERQQKLLEGQLVSSVIVATPPVLRWGAVEAHSPSTLVLAGAHI